MIILVVEDERDMSAFISRGLEAEGFTVKAVADGRKAIDLIESNDYDVVTLDLMLPGATGYEVLKSVREQGINVPILIVSGLSSVDDRVEALDQGADDFLVKPFAVEELVARVRALARRSHQADAPTLVVGELELNTATHDLKRAGQTIPLTQREYAIIELLMRHADRILTRSVIGEHVYGFEYDLSSNVIDVHIARLRRKLDLGFEKSCIKTVRDSGYRLVK
jgi:DNA-binding response OmpR family regulator